MLRIQKFFQTSFFFFFLGGGGGWREGVEGLSGFSLMRCFFVVDERREDSNAAIGGPSSAHQRNAIKML